MEIHRPAVKTWTAATKLAAQRVVAWALQDMDEGDARSRPSPEDASPPSSELPKDVVLRTVAANATNVVANAVEDAMANDTNVVVVQAAAPSAVLESNVDAALRADDDFNSDHDVMVVVVQNNSTVFDDTVVSTESAPPKQ